MGSERLKRLKAYLETISPESTLESLAPEEGISPATAKAKGLAPEVVEELAPRGPNHVVLPSWTLSAIAVVPGGAHPSYAMGYSMRDNAFYTEWDEISRDREVFATWVEEHVLGTEDHASYLASIGVGAERV